MYIKRFKVKNYLCHKSTDLPLTPVTVFVGQNGGGKTALFDALLNFSMVARGNIRQAFGPYPFSYFATKYHGAYRFESISFDVEIVPHAEAETHLRYELEYSQEGSPEAGVPNFRISRERLISEPGASVVFDRADVYTSPLKRALPFLENDRGIFAALRTAYLDTDKAEPEHALFVDTARTISRLNRFRLNPYELASPSRLPDVSRETENVPRIGYQGEDLAACLYYLKETNSLALEEINSKVRQIVPQFKEFDFSLLGPDRIAFQMVFDDSRGSVPAVRVSSGLLLYVGLMVLTYSPNRPPVMLIEEPENGLTPGAISHFYAAVRDLAFRSNIEERSQILISSHSPFVICEAWNGEDRNFIKQVRIENGCSTIRSFDEAIKDYGIVLQKTKEGRTDLSLKAAERVMCG